MAVFTSVISVFLVVPLIATSQAACPNIVNRSAWGARSASSSSLRVNPPTHVIIHHTASQPCTTKDDCSKLVKSVQNLHINTNKWSDIGYNFLVGEDGNVYEARGWGKRGSHAPKYNSKSIGICFIGTFTSTTPNAAALQAAKDLIDCGVSQGKISRDYKLVGHRQVKATECPGNSLYQEIQNWSKWASTP